MFWLVVAPQEREKTQHTPKEEAQEPEAEPPWLRVEHSRYRHNEGGQRKILLLVGSLY